MPRRNAINTTSIDYFGSEMSLLCDFWPEPVSVRAQWTFPLPVVLELRILFFHSIWKLSRRRRFSSQPLEPNTET
ncbi:BQ2448_6990 [Microbotryum intermedium]|uniref:BQ2448_6990 protein n=1 Tax=Microbotryum intermedium TaxID=269621 RepID=A0A238FIT5_9BASI|nr:BQ2448_6990 [Microbotryum intermedium]